MILILAGLSLLAGCARGGRRVARDERPDALADARPAAAALVFDPPVLADAPPPDLSRDGREPEAFVGFAEGVTEYFYLRWDDRQSNWGSGGDGFGHGRGNDYYERRAISEKTGALYR